VSHFVLGFVFSTLPRIPVFRALPLNMCAQRCSDFEHLFLLWVHLAVEIGSFFFVGTENFSKSSGGHVF